ncbi:MAG: metallophosphoesterase [Lachnospiraceae bacterium]|nr:metallophosphoesterase [Lachnospiraceae bacterium]
MSVKNNKKKNWIIPAAVLVVFVLWSLWFWVPVTETIRLDPPDGSDQTVRIALITDLHSCWYGKDQKDLIDRIEKEEPDFVLLGGDIFDDVLKDEGAETVIRQLVPKYPCYYVTGNHEYWSERVDEMKAYLSDAGVHVLAGDCETLTVKGRSFDICGVDDPTRMMEADWQDQLKQAWEQTNEDHVKILVSHRPELIEEYGKYDFDLVVTGHAHAGQFRIPFVNIGLYAPNQGAFPRYVSGTYPLENGGTMVVSRGLARESTPAPRYFNHPELVMIEM